ncbi:MAG: MipA/OmpV family protein [Alphaproteobacteria bacterium]|nr:MipA/OmpV family protein [Alphaproteobacteria bacterium]
MRAFLVATALCLSLSYMADAQAQAQAPAQPSGALGPDWKVRLGGGAAYLPKYEGADEFKLAFIPVINVSYRDLVFVDGSRRAIGVNVLRSGPLRVGPMLRHRAGREEGDSNKLRGTGDINSSFELGAFAEVAINENFMVGVDATQDITNEHEGFVAAVRARYTMPFSPRMRATINGGFTWASDSYMKTYFGISTLQANRSGLTVFTAQADVKDINFVASLGYDITANVDLTGFVGYKRMLGDAKNSPIVNQRGDENNYMFGATVAYKF